MTETIVLDAQAAVELARTAANQHPRQETAAIDTAELGKAITRQASKQTYFTIRLLADRAYADAAFRLYAYFRWVDDMLDERQATKAQRLAFLQRQQRIVACCYQGTEVAGLEPEELILADLIASDRDRASGLGLYLQRMMAVMAFDAERKGRSISGVELEQYTRSLATAVTEALHYCIGHGCYAPGDDRRYHAVQAAHITHMLRDAVEDTANGYINIPREYLQRHGIEAGDFQSEAYRAWVKSRVVQARKLFASGKRCVAQVENRRCRLAGYAYIARFEVVLDLIEQDDYLLRQAYPQRKSGGAALKMIWAAAKNLASE